MPGTERTIHTRLAEIRLSESRGNALPLLMLHGANTSRHVFARQFDSPLADAHRLIALDFPGHGDSSDASDPSAAYSFAGLAEVTAEVLEKINVSRAVVLGWSLGGHVGIELLHSCPAIAGLLICGAPPVGRGPLGLLRGFQMHLDMLLASKRNFSERDATRFAELCFGDEVDPAFIAMIRRADGRARVNLFRSLMLGQGADQRQVVEDSTTPVLIVNGENDPFVRVSYFDNLTAASLWGGHCHLIDGAGHSPFWQQAEPFNALLARFLRHVMRTEFENEIERRRQAGAA